MATAGDHMSLAFKKGAKTVIVSRAVFDITAPISATPAVTLNVEELASSPCLRKSFDKF